MPNRYTFFHSAYGQISSYILTSAQKSLLMQAMVAKRTISMPLEKKKSRDLISLFLMAAIYKNKLIRIKKISTMQLSPKGTRQRSCRVWNRGFSPKHTESNGIGPLLSEKNRKNTKARGEK
ncbi:MULTISPECIES: hypothetical protein [Bacillaceae]|jgi:hypothetical protein|uniref:hypothetical protein n=1 Tax=Bacillaceae TaxID=186817 RepID=UPI00203E9593|nr:hypothetical protein [Caldibacillus thermoamylovorans]MCM3053188.1 hypothetical protein [Caldibacillus thermoamylovorans]